MNQPMFDDDVPEEVEPAGRAQHHFAMVPMGVLTSGVSHRAMVVYAMLRSYVRPGYATFPRIGTIAKAFGIPERTIQRGLSELQEAGLLRIGKRTSPQGFRRANEYYFPDLPDNITDMPDMTAPSAPDLAVSSTSNLAVDTASNLAEQEEEKLEVEKPEVEKPRAKARGRTTTLPASFAVDDEMLRWAMANVSFISISTETEKFKAWHQAKGSRFVDWKQAWRNWMLKAKEFQTQRNAGPAPGQGVWSVPTIAPDDPRWDK